jgi:hypothetical protein
MSKDDVIQMQGEILENLPKEVRLATGLKNPAVPFGGQVFNAENIGVNLALG